VNLTTSRQAQNQDIIRAELNRVPGRSASAGRRVAPSPVHRSPGRSPGASAPVASAPVAVSFSLDTVSQSDISGVSLEVFEQYATKQLRASQTLIDRLEVKSLIIAKLKKFGFAEQAEKMKLCSANYKAIVCGRGHSFRAITDYRCRLPFCPDCCRVKANAQLARILPKIYQALRDDPSLIVAFNTLTLKSDKKRNLKAGCQEIKSVFRKLRKRKIWKDCVGGFGKIENTYSKKYGHHPHLHSILLLKNYIPQKSLSDALFDITGDSKIVDIRSVHHIASGLVECIKYPFKPSDILKLGKSQIKEMIDLKGERLGVSFGVLFGIEVDDDILDDLKDEYSEFNEETKTLEIGDSCPICGSRLDLIDFTAKDYARFIANVPNKLKARGSPG
jgi:hypothetical protein